SLGGLGARRNHPAFPSASPRPRPARTSTTAPGSGERGGAPRRRKNTWACPRHGLTAVARSALLRARPFGPRHSALAPRCAGSLAAPCWALRAHPPSGLTRRPRKPTRRSWCHLPAQIGPLARCDGAILRDLRRHGGCVTPAPCDFHGFRSVSLPFSPARAPTRPIRAPEASAARVWAAPAWAAPAAPAWAAPVGAAPVRAAVP